MSLVLVFLLLLGLAPSVFAATCHWAGGECTGVGNRFSGADMDNAMTMHRAWTDVAISSNAITITGDGKYRVTACGGNLQTITNANADTGDMVWLTIDGSGCTSMTVEDTTGNIELSADLDAEIDSTEKFLLLIYNGTNYVANLVNAPQGDKVDVEVGDNGGTFLDADTKASFEDSGDIDFDAFLVAPGIQTFIRAWVRADSVALTTDTTGNYVTSVATSDPLTGGAAASEGATLTLGLDTTKINDTTWGDNTDTTIVWTFDHDAVTNTSLEFANGNVLRVRESTLQLDNDQYLQFGHPTVEADMGRNSNGAGDDLFQTRLTRLSATDTAAWWIARTLDPSGMTDHDNYLSPTLVLVNDEGADANDYSAVIIGARTQADVAVAHYFDLYAMTGASDGAVDATTTEVAAIFRIGNGSGAPTEATTPTDTFFTNDVEVTGSLYVGVGLDAVGAVDMDYGSGDVTDHTFQTDGTGDTEIVLPADSIGPDELDSTTGAYDFGSVTSLEIPNGTNPTVDAVGKVGVDTTDNQVLAHNGSATVVLGVEDTKCIIVESPVNTDNFFFFRTERAIEVLGVDCIVENSTSIDLTFQECDADGGGCGTIEAVTCLTTNSADNGIDDSDIAAGVWLRAVFSNLNGSPGHVNGCLRFREKRT